MKTALVAIGNSRGIRIPKPVIEQCGLKDEVELSVKHGQVILQAPVKNRQGWDQAFARMSRLKDDQLLDDAVPNAFDNEEWQWK